jgi:uncharacterized repeat protein (TIGR01451 family)
MKENLHASRGALGPFVVRAAALLAVALNFHAATAVFAQDKGDVTVILLAQKVARDAAGRENLVPADYARPGEIIQYDAVYQNRARHAVFNLQPTLPIPAGLEYVPGTASPAPHAASLDGKKFEPIPLKRKVTLPDGTVEEREVPPTEYRALRWQLGDLPAGGRATVIARARVATTPTFAAK